MVVKYKNHVSIRIYASKFVFIKAKTQAQRRISQTIAQEREYK